MNSVKLRKKSNVSSDSSEANIMYKPKINDAPKQIYQSETNSKILQTRLKTIERLHSQIVKRLNQPSPKASKN